MNSTVFNEQPLTGFLLINKPADITSFDCIRWIKKVLPKNTKIGHTGTLDDFATGLLIICIGRQATRMSSALMGLSKEYVFTAKLGELTDSLDLTGKVLETVDDINVTKQQLVDAINLLCPSYDQIPPIYSALKHEGQPLYKLIRKGLKSSDELEKIVATKGRTVTISDFQVLDFSPPFFTVRMTVSKGAYVRSLANDIAQKLGLPATTHKLERTMINALSLDQAQKLDVFKSIEDVEKHLISLETLQNLLKQG